MPCLNRFTLFPGIWVLRNRRKRVGFAFIQTMEIPKLCVKKLVSCDQASQWAGKLCNNFGYLYFVVPRTEWHSLPVGWVESLYESQPEAEVPRSTLKGVSVSPCILGTNEARFLCRPSSFRRKYASPEKLCCPGGFLRDQKSFCHGGL